MGLMCTQLSLLHSRPPAYAEFIAAGRELGSEQYEDGPYGSRVRAGLRAIEKTLPAIRARDPLLKWDCCLPHGGCPYADQGRLRLVDWMKKGQVVRCLNISIPT